MRNEGGKVMICNKCNHVLPNDSSFCQYCGERLLDDFVTNNTVEENQSLNCYNVKDQKSNQNKKRIKNFKMSKCTLTLSLISIILFAINIFQVVLNVNLNDDLYHERVYSDNLVKKINEIEDRNSSIYSEYSFYNKYAVVVYDDNTNYYHKYYCDFANKNNSFWIYNVEAALRDGYVPCPYCCR